MKFLKLSKESEVNLRTALDLALKSGGMEIHNLVKKVLDSVTSTDYEYKQIEINEDLDKVLYTIFDRAIKFSGFDVYSVIQSLIDSICENKENDYISDQSQVVE